MTRISKIRGSS